MLATGVNGVLEPAVHDAPPTAEGVLAFVLYRLVIPVAVLVLLQRRLRSQGREPRGAWRAAAVFYLGIGVVFSVPYVLLLETWALGSPATLAVTFLKGVLVWPGLLLFLAGGALPVLPGPN